MIKKLKSNTLSLSIVVCGLAAAAITSWALPSSEVQSHNEFTTSMGSSLPVKAEARQLLVNMLNHHHWMSVPIEQSKSVLAWMVHPIRSDFAPVVVLKSTLVEPSDWIRAIGDQLATEGYVVIVPDVLSEVDESGNIRRVSTSTVALQELAKREEATLASVMGHSPEMNFQVVMDEYHHDSPSNRLDSADHAMREVEAYNPHHDTASIDHDSPVTTLEVNEDLNLVTVKIHGVSRTFNLVESEWPVIVRYINGQTGNNPVLPSFRANGQAGFIMGQTTAVPTPQAPGTGYELGVKNPSLPADYYTAEETLLDSTLRSEWIDIPLEGSTTELHTYIVYPEGEDPAGVVIVMHHGVGLDDWQRALANQIAEDGFIAVAADTWSGTGPDGGNWDSSEFIDEAMRAAAGKISPEEAMRRYKAARDYALTLPRANGKTASVGFCMGGGFSFRFATEVPDLNAAVVFYGGTPDEEALANIQAPVLGFYGENDARVTAAVQPTEAAMERLGKYYEAHIYPDTTHSFALFQQLGGNWEAIQDAWPRMIDFFQENLL